MNNEYYINKDSCSCSNSPYFLINNLFKELDTEKKKRIARLNLGITSTDGNVRDLIEFIGKDKKLPSGGIYYYYKGIPVLCRIGTLTNSISYLGEEIEEVINIQAFCYLTQGNYNSTDTKYFVYKVGDRENRIFLQEYTGENVPLEIKKLFKSSDTIDSGNGIDISVNGEKQTISVKLDSTSESYLTVGTDGVKLSGVGDAINNAIGALDANITKSDGFVSVTINEADGKITDSSSVSVTYGDYTNTQTDGIAKTADTKTYVDNKINALDVTDTAVDSQYVSSVSETDGKISVSRTDISGAKLNNYTKGTNASSITSTDTINQAFSKIENKTSKLVNKVIIKFGYHAAILELYSTFTERELDSNDYTSYWQGKLNNVDYILYARTLTGSEVPPKDSILVIVATENSETLQIVKLEATSTPEQLYNEIYS